MPEINLVISNKDRLAIIRWAIVNGCVIVPDKLYATRTYVKLASHSDLDKFPGVPQFWILRADWMCEDLQMRPVQNKYEGAAFYIAQRIGGPTIRFLLYSERREDNADILANGSIDHYPTYYFSRDNSQYKAPVALLDFYKESVRYIKSTSIRIVGAGGSAWISAESAKLVLGRAKYLPRCFEQASTTLKLSDQIEKLSKRESRQTRTVTRPSRPH